jgi:hypothetical protein
MEGAVRLIGMDIHRVGAEVVSLLDGEIESRTRRISDGIMPAYFFFQLK